MKTATRKSTSTKSKTKPTTMPRKPVSTVKKSPTKKSPTKKTPVVTTPAVTPVTPTRTYSAVVGYRSKVWHAVYAQRMADGRVEVVVGKPGTLPEVRKEVASISTNPTTDWAKVAAFPTEKQLAG